MKIAFLIIALGISDAHAASAGRTDWRDLEAIGEIPIVETGPLDRVNLATQDNAELGGPARVALVLPLSAELPSGGAMIEDEHGEIVSFLRVRAADASWMRLVFEDWSEVGDAEINVIDPARPDLPVRRLEGAAGPDGDYWSPIFFTNEVILEYRASAPVLAAGVVARPAPSVRLSRVVSGYRGFGDEVARNSGDSPTDENDTADRGALPCQTDFNCVSLPILVDEDATATWIVCSGGDCTQCSGTLINRDWCAGDFCITDNPLMFLTAASCGAATSNLHTTVLIFEFLTNSCNGQPPDPATLPQTRAQTMLVSNSQTDIALLGIGSEIFADNFVYPSNQITTDYWFAASCILSSPGYMLHHPAGSFLRVATLDKCGPFDSEPLRTAAGGCTSNNGYKLIGIRDGAAEPGSHGAPIFVEGDFRVISLLSCVNNSADCDFVQTGSGARFDLTEPQLRPFIDPVDPLYVNPAYLGYERGTAAEPMRSVGRAAFAAWGGTGAGEIRRAPGNYGGSRAYLGRPCTLRLANPGGSAVVGQ